MCALNLKFLNTHLPAYLAICGQGPMLVAEALAVIGGMSCIGSLTTGWLCGKYPKHILLGLLSILRSFIFAAYFMLPPPPASTLLFGAALELRKRVGTSKVARKVSTTTGRHRAPSSGVATSRRLARLSASDGGGQQSVRVAAPDNEQRLDQKGQIGEVLDQLPDVCASAVLNTPSLRPNLRKVS